MSHAGLVWASLRRRPLQSLLALACATMAFAIYGVMFGVLASFRHSSIQNATFEQQLLTGAIVLSGAGMALILLLTAGAMAHAVRLRLYEFGVLKALGFSHRRIIALVMTETAAPCVRRRPAGGTPPAPAGLAVSRATPVSPNAAPNASTWTQADNTAASAIKPAGRARSATAGPAV